MTRLPSRLVSSDSRHQCGTIIASQFFDARDHPEHSSEIPKKTLTNRIAGHRNGRASSKPQHLTEGVSICHDLTEPGRLMEAPDGEEAPAGWDSHAVEAIGRGGVLPPRGDAPVLSPAEEAGLAEISL